MPANNDTENLIRTVEVWLSRVMVCSAVVFAYSMVSSSLGHGAFQAGDNAYNAIDVGIVSAFTAPRSGGKEFYRLSVR